MASNTALSPFELLPHVVLDIICDYLDDESGHRPDLCAFSLTSRRCCAATKTRRFNQIVLVVPNLDDLETILGDLKAVLGHGERYGLVHRLKVQGVPQGPGPWDWTMRQQGDDGTKHAEDDDNAQSIEHNFDGPPFCRLKKVQYRVISGGGHDKNVDWLPLAAFIRELPFLKDLVWSSSVPKCLLDALHDGKRPPCRLHVSGFHIPGLVYDRDSPIPISSETYALVTSPALYSIKGSFSRFNHEGFLDYSPEAVYLMMQGLAPNLTNVWLSQKEPPGVSLSVDQSIARGRPAWRGFFLAGPMDEEMRLKENGSTGSLRNMRIDFRLQPQVLNGQSMANLRHLHLQWSSDTCRVLADLVTAGHVPHLEMLSLVRISSDFDADQATVYQILSHAKPLRHLCLEGHFTMRTFDRVMHRHGSTLRSLCLDPSPASMYQQPENVSRDGVVDPLFACSLGSVQMIAKHCPHLEEVLFGIQRTRGDAREVAIYRALGTLRRLKRVVLRHICTIHYDYGDDDDASDTASSDRIFIEFLKQALSNHATDEVLARAIFDEIFDTVSRPGGQGPGRPQYLRIEPCCHTGNWVPDSALYNALSALGRHWVCQTANLDMPPNKGNRAVAVRQVQVYNTRQAVEALLFEDWDSTWLTETENYEAMFKSLWPGDGPPWDRWTSLPLETEE